MSNWSLRIEALCRCSFGDDGVVQVTKGKIRTGPISFTKEDPNRNWSGPITRTGLAHKLGIGHLIQTGRTQKNRDMSNCTRKYHRSQQTRVRTHMKQGCRSRKAIRSEVCPVNSCWPLMVSLVPPETGPLSGTRPVSLGFWGETRTGELWSAGLRSEPAELNRTAPRLPSHLIGEHLGRSARWSGSHGNLDIPDPVIPTALQLTHDPNTGEQAGKDRWSSEQPGVN